VTGHRYVIRYELNAGMNPLTVFKTQQYYEKLAANAGFTVEKNGAVGDVSETFRRLVGTHETWAYFEPAVMANVLTVVESSAIVAPPAPPPPRLAMTATAPTVVIPVATRTPTPVIAMPLIPRTPVPVVTVPVPVVAVPRPVPTPVSVPAPVAIVTPPPGPPPSPKPAFDPNDDSLFTALSQDGRVVVPFVFQPGKDGLDTASQPQIDRVVAMMKRHPDLFLRIEGHTDNSGDPDDNMRLSAQRALAIQAKLMEAKVEKKRLDAVGVGGLQPLASNATAEGREKNRRIELVMWKKYPAYHKPATPSHNGL
jgi:outer membrane protein OmpA-like peptidoglycan-associated protein